MRRRRFRRNPIGRRKRFGGGSRINFATLFSRDNLMVAGGAVGASIATSFILRQFGPVKIVNGTAVANTGFKLPGVDSRWGALGYNVAIPALLAIGVQRFNSRLAQGAGIMAAVNLVSSVVAFAQGALLPVASPAPTTGTSAYLDVNGMRALPNRPPGYDAVNAFGQSIYNNASAFRGDTWALSE